ncbi:GNAT family N-acetyltransferase [Streptomyces tailanensis]|uniref:GNAT family N-acetyltransferase n=1 Tax=Streptomyces tailanensis TaxID=2569858 RepID=UPI00319E3024
MRERSLGARRVGALSVRRLNRKARQGVGKALMRKLRGIAEERPGCSRLEWMTDRENEGARSFYRELGFAELDGKIVYRLETGTGVIREPAHAVSA